MVKNSGKPNPRVSRHTMVIRKAKEDDARRLAEADPGADAAIGFKLPPHPAATNAKHNSTEVVRIPRKKAIDGPDKIRGQLPSSGQNRESAKKSTIGKVDDLTNFSRVTRYFGPGGSSSRSAQAAGGDTLIRYASGRLEIRRGARRISLRRQILLGYAIGYFLLFSFYGYFLIFGKVGVSPEDFVHRSFSLRHGASLEDLERAAFEAMRGYRTPAEVRLAEPLSFYDANKETVRIEAGARLTLPVAAKLGKAIIEDMEKPVEARVFTKPLSLYKESFIASMNWPHWLAVYNSIGFFLLIASFLWRPFMNYLSVQGRKTAAALKSIIETREEALKLNSKYAELAQGVETRKAGLLAEAEAEAEANLNEMMASAKSHAEDIAGGILNSLGIEAERQAARLGSQTAIQACDQAKAILEKRLGEAEHVAAIEELIADILAWRADPTVTETGNTPDPAH